MTCDEMYLEGGWTVDGTYGRKLFYEARGYTVTDCYNQQTDNRAIGGFSFAQFKAEIDAGHPVMLHIGGQNHTIVGIGYEDVTHTVYIHGGWIDATSTMPWGGKYGGMELDSVSIVNLDDDATPDAFTFVDQTGAAVNQVITSNTITVTGINPAVALSITGGEYRINSEPWTSALGTVGNGDSVTVRQTSAATYPVMTDTILTIGGVSDTFSVTTAADDTTPDAFTLVDQTGASLSTLIISDTITVAGINLPVGISITGGEYRINSGLWTSAAGKVSSGDSVTVRLPSAPTYPVTTDAVLTIGGVSDTFSVTTRDFEVKIIPHSLGWFLGEKEKTRSLLVIGPKGMVFDDTTAVRWENSGIAVLSKRAFFKRFMVMRVTIDGAALDKGDYWCQIGTCGGTLTLVK